MTEVMYRKIDQNSKLTLTCFDSSKVTVKKIKTPKEMNFLK